MPQDIQVILYPNSGIADTIVIAHKPVTSTSTSTETKKESLKVAQGESSYLPGGNEAPMYIFFAVLLVGIIARFRSNLRTGKIDNESAFGESSRKDRGYLTYYGDELDLTKQTLITVLNKRFPYYNTLSSMDQTKFVSRLKNFISEKTFKIHDKSWYDEMPILICATAIQLTFGLEKYMLPNFEFIHIYPREFMRMYPTVRILEGSVSGKSLPISWKHFLKGYQKPNDGQNVGLHEWSHAYYYQNFQTGKHVDKRFVESFDDFNHSGNKAFEKEQAPGYDLYSEYAVKDFQEFWAESVEIFFGKPMLLKAFYPELYVAMSSLLNQDPANTLPSMVS